MSPELAALLVALGFAIGAYAAAIGAGGGFLVAPLLLFRYPEASPAAITAASLTVVLATSIGQTIVTAREWRVDHPLALAMATVAVPAALLGGFSTTVLPRTAFALIFATLLIVIATYIVIRPVATIAVPASGWAWRRERTDRDGNRYLYRIPLLGSIAPNAGAAFFAALSGIGGGPLGVPVMTRVMHVPHALAVPTMHFLILVQTTAVLTYHFTAGNQGDPMRDVPWLAAGVLLAAPVGVWLRRRLGEGVLMRALAVGIFFIAVRTVIGEL
jgi:uncharacterized protein